MPPNSSEPAPAPGIRKHVAVAFLLTVVGTGHASLSYLHRLPISTIKIDRQ